MQSQQPCLPVMGGTAAWPTRILRCECLPALAVSTATVFPQTTRRSSAKTAFTFLGSRISAPDPGGKAIGTPTGVPTELPHLEPGTQPQMAKPPGTDAWVLRAILGTGFVEVKSFSCPIIF